MINKPKVIAVVGPTSSGKTSLSIDLAKKFNGEVVSADSRQIYKGLDIGTGKVTEEEMAGVKHHLLSTTDPILSYNAAEFELDATTALMGIHGRDRLPIIAGGTFFYLDMLRGKQQVASVPKNDDFRLSLFECPTPELFERLKTLDPARAEAIDQHNRPRLVRALEIIEAVGKVPKVEKKESLYEWLVIGIDVDKIQLHKNIHQRLEERLEAGMVTEIKNLHQQGLSYERMYDLGLEYRYVSMYLQQQLTHEEMFETIETKSRQYAKRQLTWLKKDTEIQWFKPENREEIFESVASFLANNS